LEELKTKYNFINA